MYLNDTDAVSTQCYEGYIKQDEMKVPGFIREDLSEVVKYV